MRGPDPLPERKALRARYRRAATEEIAAARTLADLIHLVGAVPTACERVAQGERACVWQASSRTYGHGTLAFSIDALPRERVMMRCLLPADGSPRSTDSCSVEVPGRDGQHTRKR